MRRSVSETELVGTWPLDETGAIGLRYAGYTSKTSPDENILVLASDGSCRARGYIEVRSSSARVPYVDTTCRWRLSSLAEQQVVIELPMTSERSFSPFFFVGEEEGHLVLWNYIDDPDQWKYIQFAQRAPN